MVDNISDDSESRAQTFLSQNQATKAVETPRLAGRVSVTEPTVKLAERIFELAEKLRQRVRVGVC